jgi:hypothetical protein
MNQTTPQQQPTWEELTPSLIEMANSDVREQSLAAYADLRTMAQLADRALTFIIALNGCMHCLEAARDSGTYDAKEVDLAAKVARQALTGESPDAKMIELGTLEEGK